MPKKKYWIAFGEHPLFTRDDNHVCYVFPGGQPGSNGTSLLSKYMEADDLESARAKLHAYIDERLDHEIHMCSMEGRIQGERDALTEAMANTEEVADSQVTSLSIGAPVNHKKKQAPKDSLLRMEDILGSDKAI